MKIAIIGTGHVGSALGISLSRAGHEVTFGSRDPNSDRVHLLVKSIGGTSKAGTIDEACAWGEVVVLATPWSGTQEAIQQAGNLQGKVVIDCTNPIGPNGTLLVGMDTSAGEQIAGWAPGAQVVKAFNAVGAGTMADPSFGGLRPSLLLCGDSVEAKRVVFTLGQDIGFEPVDCGSLPTARFLEPMAMLRIQLAYVQGLGPDTEFKIVVRDPTLDREIR